MAGQESESWVIGEEESPATPAQPPRRVVSAAARRGEMVIGAPPPPPAKPARRSPWRGAFLISAAILGLSFAALVVVLLTYMDDSGGNTNSQQPATGDTPKPANTPTTTQPGTTATPTERPRPTPTASASTIAEIPLTCGDLLAPLDKQHVLARDCAPNDLEPLPPSASTNGAQTMRSEARAAILELFAAAQRDGFTLVVSSSYRSYDNQVATFNQNVASGGLAYAERTSARAGHSEHQLGTTADVTSASAGYQLEAFEGTPEAKWLAENSWKFGFIISYPAGKEPITGYAYEPWHIRYLGKDTAQKVKNSGLTLHEFLLR